MLVENDSLAGMPPQYLVAHRVAEYQFGLLGEGLQLTVDQQGGEQIFSDLRVRLEHDRLRGDDFQIFLGRLSGVGHGSQLPVNPDRVEDHLRAVAHLGQECAL